MATKEEMDKDNRIAELEKQLLLAKLTDGGSGVTSRVSEINGVTVKLPDFYEHDPEMWFVRAECQFRTRGIKDDLTKFDHIVQCLSEKVARRVRKIILFPPATQRVATLKSWFDDGIRPHSTREGHCVVVNAHG